MTSSMRIERYSMSLPAELILGEAKFFHVRERVGLEFEPHGFSANAPCKGFVTLENVYVDNVDILLKDDGSEAFESHDAFHFNPNNGNKLIVGRRAAHGLSMRIRYTGLIPPKYTPGQRFGFFLSFLGPSGSMKGQ